MRWVVIVVRTLVGLGFTVTGLDGFLHFLTIPPPEPGTPAREFMGLLADSKYFYAVKVCELAGGLMLLSGRMAPLGITLLMPVAVNILLYEVFLLKQPGPGYALVPLLAFLIWGYRRHFAPVFTTSAEVTA
jgi:putative oxidoreductase